MRKRIWRMSEDKFDNKKTKLKFSEEKVVLEGIAGTKIQGGFSFESEGDIPVKGIVYSSNPYVQIPKPQFQGTHITIGIEVVGQHYIEGDSLQGEFTIVCNGGEYRLPFVVSFCSEKLMCSVGEIQSLDDFAALAKGHWNEAMHLFYSKAFADFIAKQEVEIQLLYAGYRKAIPSAANLEEFMVAAGQKDSVGFQVKEREESFFGITENKKESILLSKTSWGYIEIDVETDCEFITVEKEKITSDFFLGSTMILNYYIHKNRMHAGKNYGCITFSCRGSVQQVHIVASLEPEEIEHEWKYRQHKREQVMLTKTYEDYRFMRITTGEWCEKTIALLEDMMRQEDENVWYPLMKAHCYIVNKQKQEALWIIQDMKHEIMDKSCAQWAYLLYLCALMEQEESYVNRLTKEMEMIFRQHPEDGRIFWVLSFLREEYTKQSHRKLQDFLQWIQAGQNSPFFYIEVYYLFMQEPYLIGELSGTTLQILHWAARKKLFTKEIALQISYLVDKLDVFSDKIWTLILEAYSIIPQEEFDKKIIAYLLRNQQYKECFLPWYKKGIDMELRLNGLYEAYMMSLPVDSIEELPHTLVLYFCYSCHLPDQKKALLYANIILNRRKMPHVYEQYLRTIERFAIEQMKQSRMDDNLAIVYQNVLEMGVVDEDMAQAVSGLLFMKKMVCLYPDISRVIVYQEQYEMPFVVPVKGRVAYVPIISSNYQIFMETKQGTLITDKKGYTMQQLMFPDPYINKLKNLAPQAIAFVLEDFDHKDTPEAYALEDIQKITAFLHSSLVAKSYLKKKYDVLITFLRNHGRDEMLERYFMEEIDGNDLNKASIVYVIELLLAQKRYEQGLRLLKAYDYLAVDKRLLLPLCDTWLMQTGFEKDEFFLQLCAYLAEHDYMTPATIVYLATNRVGPTEWMLKVWKQAMEEKLHVQDLEENILFQALYCESQLEQVVPVFDSYMTRGKDKMLLEAYINYWSHCYMISKEHVPEKLFTYLAYYFDKEIPLKGSAKLAYMKFLSSLDLLSDREYQVLDDLLQHYLMRNVYFSFYREVDWRLQVKYHLYDKHFVEYRGNPKDYVTIVYQLDGQEPVEEEMIEIYDGIYVKQFVVFFGETVEYQIYVEQVSDLPVVADSLTISTGMQDKTQSRYERINQMQNHLLYGEQKALFQDMKQYQGLDCVTRTLFTTV